MTTTQDIEELRGLAQAATPGIWCHVQRGISRWHGERIEADLNPICDFAMLQDCCVHEYDRAYENAAYIQAANPAAIIGLIDTIQAQAERIKELELDLDVQAGSIEAVQAVNARQAERIKELERERDTQAKAYELALVERDQLRGQTDPCYTCDHFREGRLPNVRIHDETCYECREYYVSKWEEKSE